jgi:sulfopyruvate decarboxylase subunit beta
VSDIDGFRTAFNTALATDDLTTVVAKVEATGPKAFVTDLGLLENRFEFARHLRSMKGRSS